MAYGGKYGRDENGKNKTMGALVKMKGKNSRVDQHHPKEADDVYEGRHPRITQTAHRLIHDALRPIRDQDKSTECKDGRRHG